MWAVKHRRQACFAAQQPAVLSAGGSVAIALGGARGRRMLAESSRVTEPPTQYSIYRNPACLRSGRPKVCPALQFAHLLPYDKGVLVVTAVSRNDKGRARVSKPHQLAEWTMREDSRAVQAIENANFDNL